MNDRVISGMGILLLSLSDLFSLDHMPLCFWLWLQLHLQLLPFRDSTWIQEWCSWKNNDGNFVNGNKIKVTAKYSHFELKNYRNPGYSCLKPVLTLFARQITIQWIGDKKTNHAIHWIVIYLGPVVPKLDNAIHWINPVSSIIQPLNNWGLVDKIMHLSNNPGQ